MPRSVRRRAFENNYCYRGAWLVRKRLQGVNGFNDGRVRFYKNVNRERRRKCHISSGVGHGQVH